MSDQPNLFEMSPNPADFMKRVRELATNSRNIKWATGHGHAWERLGERGVPIRLALETLRIGELSGPITKGKHPGDGRQRFNST